VLVFATFCSRLPSASRFLAEIGISSARIRNAILDYYRAYERRSAWARENLLVSGELEDYEDRLEDEWPRYRDVVCERLDQESAESAHRGFGIGGERAQAIEGGSKRFRGIGAFIGTGWE
jgi:C-terminal domain 7 of the ABC-three component (ABC-3C) systems